MKLVLQLNEQEELLLRRVFPRYFMPGCSRDVKDATHWVLRELLEAGVKAFAQQPAIAFPVEAKIQPRRRE